MYQIAVMKMVYIVVLIAITGVLVAAVSNGKTERRPYTTIKSEGGFEIRYYPSAIIATVESPGGSYMGNSNDNFRRLAGYIFGGNMTEQKIAMTAPVAICRDGNTSRMSFVMPANYTREQLPMPKDSTVKIQKSDEGYFAAIKFGGYAVEKTIMKKENQLKALLAAAGLTTIGEYNYLGYNAPWDLINRENEIVVKIGYGAEPGHP